MRTALLLTNSVFVYRQFLCITYNVLVLMNKINLSFIFVTLHSCCKNVILHNIQYIFFIHSFCYPAKVKHHNCEQFTYL